MTDRFTVRTVVVTLAACVAGGVATMAFLALTQTPVPDQFDRLVTLLAGGLIGMLVSTRSTGADGDAMPVVGPTGGPVETVEVAPASPEIVPGQR